MLRGGGRKKKRKEGKRSAKGENDVLLYPYGWAWGGRKEQAGPGGGELLTVYCVGRGGGGGVYLSVHQLQEEGGKDSGEKEEEEL